MIGPDEAKIKKALAEIGIKSFVGFFVVENKPKEGKMFVRASSKEEAAELLYLTSESMLYVAKELKIK